MTTIKVYGDSRLKYLGPFVNHRNDTKANIEVIGTGGATIRSTASQVWQHMDSHPYDLILFNAGINELTRFNEETGRYVMAFETAEAAVEHCLTAYQEFELAFHQKYIHSHMIFGTLTGMDIARYAYTQDKDPVHQLVINDTVRILNRELNNINERNWVPTCWLGSHVHRNRRRGMTTNYYDQLSDGLHPTDMLLDLWAQDIVHTAYLVS